jgi:multidrug efflux system membrane fusion protein
VTVAQAVRADVDRYIEEIGNTAAVDDVAIRAQVQGTLVDVRVRDGQRVKKGDLLFLIDPRPFEAALAEARAGLQSTEVELANAKRDLARLLQLPQGAASAQDIDTARSTVDRLIAQTAVDKARINTAEINLSYTKIEAPVSGRLGKIQVTQGNLVVPGMGGMALTTLRSLDPIYVDFTTPERNLYDVRAAMDSGAAVVEVRPDSNSTKPTPHHGKLSFIDNQVQSSVGLLQLRATVDNPDNEPPGDTANANGRSSSLDAGGAPGSAEMLWPGQFVRVRMVVGHLKDAVLIPADAVDQGEGGARAYVIKPAPDGTSTVELRRPKLGQRQPPETPGGFERIVVEEGISPGEQLVLKGRWLLGPNAKVKIVQDPPQTAIPPQPSSSPSAAKSTP